jgi:3-phenylpropionate/trans-cinnamate dioxygenase ferredoxin reductase subunit
MLYMIEGTGTKPMVIIGGGKAGGTAATTLREDGFGGPVVIISAEPGLPFGRPPLSKTYLRSEENLDGWYTEPADWYGAHDVELLTESAVTAIDAAAHSLVLASGRELEYQKILIATGGRNRQLRIPGAELPGIYYLRTVAECDAIKREAVAGRRAVVVGMGFIGCEVAASLTQLGVGVTAVYPSRDPLDRVLGQQIGALIGAIHRSKGVRLLPGAQVAAFEGTERLAAAVTADGERIGCDFAVVGVGIEPDVPAFPGSSVSQENGILVDELCRTSAADIYAAGDVANHLHPVLGRVRVEHYNSAGHHGAAAARSMLPPSITSIISGPTSTSTRSSTLATRPSGTTSPSAAIWRNERLSVSTCSQGLCAPPSASTVAVIPNMNPTPRWRPAPASSPGAPSPAAAR